MRAANAMLIGVAVAAIGGCSAGSTAQMTKNPTNSASSTGYGAQQLVSALMDRAKGMEKVFGPEAGTYSDLHANQSDNQRQAKPRLNKPHCAQVGKLDEKAPDVAKAPAAVIAFRNAGESLSEALVALPSDRAAEPFATGLPKDCTSYRATIGGKDYTYTTRSLAVPVKSDDSLAYLTKAEGGSRPVKFGVVTIRHGNVLMTLVSTGSHVSPATIQARAKEAYERVHSALP